MAKYIVSYDLRGKEREKDYAKLEEELEDTYEAKRLLQSVWGLSSELPYKELYDDIKRLIKKGDGLIVVCMGSVIGRGLENKLSSF